MLLPNCNKRNRDGSSCPCVCVRVAEKRAATYHRPAATMQSLLYSVGEMLTPLLRDSRFLESGVLTPEEVGSRGHASP